MVWRGASGTGDGSWSSLHDLLAWTCTKATIVVAVTATGEVGKAMSYGTIPNTTAALEKLVQRLRTAGSGALSVSIQDNSCCMPSTSNNQASRSTCRYGTRCLEPSAQVSSNPARECPPCDR
jgi:hypothetical protein